MKILVENEQHSFHSTNYLNLYAYSLTQFSFKLIVPDLVNESFVHG